MTEIAHTIAGYPAGARAGFRWFGPQAGDVAIRMIAQIPGITEVVSALHHVPNGDIWTLAEILKRKIEVEFADEVVEPSGATGGARDDFYMKKYRDLVMSGDRTGLTWSTIESLPFTEEIKNGSDLRDLHIKNYQLSLDNLGIVNRMLAEPALQRHNAKVLSFHSVMGNFMLVADWTRTGYTVLEDGSRALEYNHTHFSAFDIFMALRHSAAAGEPDFEAYKKDGSYNDEEILAAKTYWDGTLKTDRKRQEALADMIIAGLPGAQASFGVGASLETKLGVFREAVLKYKGMTVAALRANIDYFLKRIIPNAKAAGVLMCCHPDDPAYSPFLGTPRAVGNVEGYKFLLERGCGVGLCFGSLTPNACNRDVMGFVKELAEFGLQQGMTIEQVLPFVHLRPIEANGKNFREGLHVSHIEELGKIIYTLVSFGWRGVFRPDHAPDPAAMHDLVTKATGNDRALGGRGYSVPGRAMGASLLIGLFYRSYEMVAMQHRFAEKLAKGDKSLMQKLIDDEFEHMRAQKARLIALPTRSTATAAE